MRLALGYQAGATYLRFPDRKAGKRVRQAQETVGMSVRAGKSAAVIDFADARAESPLESIARVAFRDCGLPPPELQVWLGGTTEPIGRVDFYWRTHRIIAEVDGALKYDGPDGPNRARQQLQRDMLLREDGFEVVHFTWDQITDTPQRVAASIRAAFQRGIRNATRPARPRGAA
jgi:hypothetical protein